MRESSDATNDTRSEVGSVCGDVEKRCYSTSAPGGLVVSEVMRANRWW